jgi:hypothetical protein
MENGISQVLSAINSLPFVDAANESLDASGGSASRNLLGAAEGALIRAAASTQTLGVIALVLKTQLARIASTLCASTLAWLLLKEENQIARCNRTGHPTKVCR